MHFFVAKLLSIALMTYTYVLHVRNLHELFIAKIGVLDLSVGEDFVILACVVLTQCQRVTDRQTDRRTDRQTTRP